MVPHRVRLTRYDLLDCREIERLALSQYHEIGLELPSRRKRSTLRQPRPKQLLAPFVIKKKRSMTIAL